MRVIGPCGGLERYNGRASSNSTTQLETTAGVFLPREQTTCSPGWRTPVPHNQGGLEASGTSLEKDHLLARVYER